MNLPEFSARHPVTVAMAVCAVLMVGFVSLQRLGTDLLPDLESPRVVIALESGDKSPREMEDLYAERLEAQLGTVRHVREVRSVSHVGRIVVSAEFAWHTDMDFALLEVHKQVAAYSGDREVDSVTVARFDPRKLPVLTLGVIGGAGRDLDELRRIAEETVKRRLEGLEGVATARVAGGRVRQVVIEPDPYLLKTHGITLAALRQRVQAANIDASGGEIEDDGQNYIVHAAGAFTSLDDIRAVTVGYGMPAGAGSHGAAFAPEHVPVALGEVAAVSYQDKEVRSLVRLNGVECVGVSVYKEADENTVRVVEDVKEELARIERDSGDISIVIVDDQARFIQAALREVYQTTAYGVLLAVLVLLVFLRSFRSTLVVCLAFPISIVATFNLMYFAGLTLNIMTLGGLALGAGMLVDNAIVVVENIYRHRQLGTSLLESATRGTREVAGAITASTITTVVVFLPIVFVRGVAGELFKDQAVTVAFSLLSSLVVALAVVPAAASRLVRVREGALDRPHRGRVFPNVVGSCVDHRYLVVVAAVMLGALAVYLLPHIGNEFVPVGDEGQFQMDLRLSEGTPIETTEAYVERVERAVAEAGGEDVGAVLARIGHTQDELAVLEQQARGENTARVSVVMRQAPEPDGLLGRWVARLGLGVLWGGGEKGRGAEALAGAIAPALATLPDLEVNYLLHESTLQQTIGAGEAPIIIRVRGPNLDTLRKLTDDIAGRMGRLPQVYNVHTSFEGGHPEVAIHLDNRLVGSFGLDPSQVAALVRQKVDGEVLGDFTAKDEQRDIEMKLADVSLQGLAGIEIENPSGALLTLGDIAELVLTEGPRTIERHRQQRTGVVTASPARGAGFSEAVAAVRAGLAGVSMPPRYRMEIGGEEARRAESFRALGLALVLAVALVYMVLAGQFESLVHPFVILLTVPLAGMGVVFAFFLLGRPLNVMAYIGAIMLAGIAVNDSIILVDYINQLRQRGLPRREAIVEAACTRLRPIMMTSLTTVLVLLPLSLGMGESARLRAPMAIAVIAGLCTSTVLTLFVIPAVYALLDRLRRTHAP